MINDFLNGFSWGVISSSFCVNIIWVLMLVYFPSIKNVVEKFIERWKR